jgi:hypothetical protein
MQLTNADLLRILMLLKFSEHDEPCKFYLTFGLRLLIGGLNPTGRCADHHLAQVIALLRASNPSPVE